MQGLGMISIRDLVKTFDGCEVISYCDMIVKRGSVCGFLGVNEAGKKDGNF